MLDLTAKQPKRAAAIKARIDALSRELSKPLDGSPLQVHERRKKRTMSEAVKRKIAAAQ
jgi:hypothetical protein